MPWGGPGEGILLVADGQGLSALPGHKFSDSIGSRHALLLLTRTGRGLATIARGQGDQSPCCQPSKAGRQAQEWLGSSPGCREWNAMTLEQQCHVLDWGQDRHGAPCGGGPTHHGRQLMLAEPSHLPPLPARCQRGSLQLGRLGVRPHHAAVHDVADGLGAVPGEGRLRKVGHGVHKQVGGDVAHHKRTGPLSFEDSRASGTWPWLQRFKALRTQAVLVATSGGQKWSGSSHSWLWSLG